VKYSEGGGRTPKPASFQDTEADTGKVEQRVVLYARLAQKFDHFTPTDRLAFVELAEQLVDMSAEDRRTVFAVASRLSK
jgi:hypothetical protein